MSADEDQAIRSKLLEEFSRAFGNRRGVYIARAPGRVNLIGDHTDYNDGFVLPATIDRAVYVALRPRHDDRVRIYASNFESRLDLTTATLGDVPGEGWDVYVSGVIKEYVKRGVISSGVEAVIYGDVPLGAGLSSSAALEVGMAMALQAAFQFEQSPEDMAMMCRHVEHTYAGVRCGIMDQFASRLGRRGHALFLDCRSLEFRHVPFCIGESNLALIILDSNVSRKLAGSKYNERRAECDRAVSCIRRFDPEVMALRDVTPDDLQAYGDGLPALLLKRARHVVTENERVLSALTATEQRDWNAFGRLMNDSHESLRTDYEVTSPELDLLAEAARSFLGTLGARMTGAGFGGCTVNLVRSTLVQDFIDVVSAAYERQSGMRPTPYVIEKNFESVVVGPDL